MRAPIAFRRGTGTYKCGAGVSSLVEITDFICKNI